MIYRLTDSPAARLIVGQLLHVVLLLIPTFAAIALFSEFSLRNIGWAQACFALGIVTAATVESALVREPSSTREYSVRDSIAMRMAMFAGAAILIVFWLAQVESILLPASGWLPIKVTGAIMLFFGIALRSAAIYALGNAFVSDIRPAATIVRHGVYARLQHPSEIGLLMIAIGGPMTLGAIWTSVLAAVVLVPVSIWRMRREDAALKRCR